MKTTKFEEFMFTIPGYKRAGFSRSLAKELWDHQEKRVDYYKNHERYYTNLYQAECEKNMNLSGMVTRVRDQVDGAEMSSRVWFTVSLALFTVHVWVYFFVI